MALKTRIAGIAFALGVILAASGCNADEATSEGGEEIDKARESISKIDKDDALAKQLPEKYRSSIKVGLTYTFPPMRYKEGDKALGAEYDLMDAVVRKLGTKMDVSEVSFDGLVPALKANRIDAAMESFADLPERRKQISFVDYYRSATALEVKKGNPLGIKGLAEMCGHSIALQSGVESVERAKKQNSQCEADGKKPIDIKLYESSNDATLAVVNGRADATGNDYPAALNETKIIQGGDALELVDKPISSDYFYGIGVRKDEKDLQQALKGAMNALIKSGEYKEIFKAYGVEKGMLEKSGINVGPSEK